MALVHAHFFSTVLGMERRIDVVLPQNLNGIGQEAGASEQVETFPVMYLLHGASDDHTIWQRRTSIERYAVSKGIAVVMPSTDLGFYADQKYGYDYFRYIAEELPQIVAEFFPCISAKREDTYVAGLSMGGFGAVKLGVLYPQRFSHVATLSGLLDPVWEYEQGRDGLHTNNFGTMEELKGSDNDLMCRMQQVIDSGKEMPRFFQAVGTEDFLYEANTRFRKAFEKQIDLTYFEEPGTHEWGFWDRNIQRVLAWLPDTTDDKKQGWRA